MSDLHALLDALARILIEKKVKVTCAESCTGGLIGAALTELSGSSAWFDMGFLTYSNKAKKQLLGVRQETLAGFGAVSLETVAEMATGALNHAAADYALAVSGIAGPTGGSVEKPVGTICFALANKDGVISSKQLFKGERQSIREQGVYYILSWFVTQLQEGF